MAEWNSLGSGEVRVKTKTQIGLSPVLCLQFPESILVKHGIPKRIKQAPENMVETLGVCILLTAQPDIHPDGVIPEAGKLEESSE